MDQQGGDNNSRHQQQQQSAAESSREPPPPLILPADQRSSLWHDHDTTILSPFLASYIGDDQAHDQTSTYQDFFSMLSNVELLSPTPTPPPPPPPLLLPSLPPPSSLILPKIESIGGFEKGESSGTKRPSDVVQVSLPHSHLSEVSTQEVEREDEQRPPRTRIRRSPHVHNLSERTRRSRITERITTLRELVPNCNKTDKASVLSDAIEYIKFLQHQLQMKLAYQSMLIQYYSSVYQMRPMVGVGGIYSSPYAATGFPMSHPFPHPFGESRGFVHPPSQLQHYTPTETTTSMEPTTATPSTSVTSLSSTFSQGESSSAQYI